ASKGSEETTSPKGISLLDEAVERAQNEGKLLVLDFYAEWCVPCKRLERETFADAKVAALLQRYVLLKLDTDQHPELGTKFGVVGLPDVRLFGSDGKQRKKLQGYQKPEAFALELEQLLKENPRTGQAKSKQRGALGAEHRTPTAEEAKKYGLPLVKGRPK